MSKNVSSVSFFGFKDNSINVAYESSAIVRVMCRYYEIAVSSRGVVSRKTRQQLAEVYYG